MSVFVNIIGKILAIIPLKGYNKLMNIFLMLRKEPQQKSWLKKIRRDSV